MLVLCTVGFILGRLQSSARNGGSVDLIGRIVQAVVNPPAQAMTSSVNATDDFFLGVFQARRIVAENRRLKADLASISLYVETISRLEREIDSLRKFNDLSAIEGKQRIPAEIIGFFPYENRLTLSVGSANGVKLGQPVVAPDGLLGRIQVVAANTSQVLLLSSPEAGNRIGALAMRNPPSAGLLKGESATTFLLEFNDPKTPVANGDLVVTSGFSDHIPRGIPIGRVIEVEDNIEFGKRQAKVYPSVAMGSVREVFVLK